MSFINKTPLINRIVMECIQKHKGGEKFFDLLDEKIRKEENIIELLLNKISSASLFSFYDVGNKANGIIVSGKFGKVFFNCLYNRGTIKHLIFSKHCILVKGGLRKGKQIEDLSFLDMQEKSYIFIDDSFYSGKTRDAIKDEVERNGGKLIHTFVVYDGSKTKDDTVSSLYRYYDQHKGE